MATQTGVFNTNTLSNSYWKKAYDSLDEDIRLNIGGANTGNNDILAALLRTAEQKRRICFHKRWKAKLPNGEVIVLRDIVEKISRWVNLFIAVGDVAIQYNPVAASLPWAAIRFILQAAINETHIEGVLVANIEVISRMIARYREFERIHLVGDFSLRSQVEECLTRLYADILKFLATAVKHFNTNTFVRGVKSVFKVPGKPIEDILEQQTELLRVASLSDAEKLRFLEDSMTRMVFQTIKRDRSLEEDQHRKLLKWLSSVPFSRHHEAISERRMADSASWLLKHDEYKRWKNSSSSAILVLQGIMGSGKSNVCSVIVDFFLQQRKDNPLSTPIAYFYCQDCGFETERAQASEVMRSILQQLTITNTNQPTVRDTLVTEFERRLAQSKIDGMDVSKLTTAESVRLVLEVAATDPLIIVVDAVDNVDERDRPALIEALEEIVISSSSVVKVFLTTRNDSHILSLLRKGRPSLNSNQAILKAYLSTIEVTRELVQGDIQLYVERALRKAIQDRLLLKEEPSVETFDLIAKRLTREAAEMFQWVNLQIEHLCQYDREEDIVSAIKDKPLATLRDSYAMVLERILSKRNPSRDIAVRAISWLLYMKEAVPPAEFIRAVYEQDVAAEDVRSRHELLTICSSLVLFDSKCQTFRFSHQSVQDFLRTEDMFSPGYSQHVIAKRCIAVCKNGPLLQTSPQLGKGDDALYQYAALYWAYHSSKVADLNHGPYISKDIISFVFDGPGDVSLTFMAWLEVMETIAANLADEHPMKTIADAVPNAEYTPLFAASVFGLGCLLEDEAIGTQNVDWNQTNRRGHTGLYLACGFGNLQVARFLIDHGANANISCGKFGNALQAACFRGHNSVVQLLLDNGVSVHEKGTFKNALEACFRGQHEKTCLKLLEHASTVRTSEDFDFALFDAYQGGFLEVIEQLNKKTQFASTRDLNPSERMKERTSNTIRRGQTGALAIFLRNRSNIDDLLPDGAIALAALHGHEKMVESLIDMGLSIEAECSLGPPLRCAALMGHENMVRRLVDYGANSNSKGKHGTPLQAAAMKGHASIAKFLIHSGAKVNQIWGTYGTALQAAAFHGHMNVVEILLNANANMNAGGLSKDAFHAAVEGAQYDIMKLMLNRGFRLSKPRYKSPHVLAYMSQRWGYSLLRTYSYFKMDFKSDKRSTPDENLELQAGLSSAEMKLYRKPRKGENYVFQAGIATGNVATVAVLLENRVNLGVSKSEILHGLTEVAQKGNLELFQLLLDLLPSSSITSSFLDTIEHAARNRSVDIVTFGLERVLRFGIDLYESNIEQLIVLACQNTVEMFRAVLSAVFPNVKRPQLKRILGKGFVVAVQGGHITIACELLKHHADVLTRKHMRSAFEAVMFEGYAELLSALCQAILHSGLVIKELTESGRSSSYLGSILYLTKDPRSEDERVALLQYAVYRSAGNGHRDILEGFLRSFKHSPDTITLALITASHNGHVDCVQSLIKHGANVNATMPKPKRDYAMRWTRCYKRRICYRWDPKKHGEVNSFDYRMCGSKQALPPSGISALQAALEGILSHSEPDDAVWKQRSRSEHEKTVQILADAGSDCNDLGGREMSPLIFAARYCSEQIVECLVKAGANADTIVNKENAILAAVDREAGGAPVLRSLLRAGAQIESEAYDLDTLIGRCLSFFKDVESVHPLYSSVPFVHEESIRNVMTTGPGATAQILLQTLPRIKLEQEGFNELFQTAAAFNSRECINLLLDMGMDVNCTADYYGTALQAASRFGHSELVEQLLREGADPNIVMGKYDTPLRAATVKGHTKTVQLLLRYGAYPGLG